MNAVITAVYERGVLRPLSPLLLPEHIHVQVQIIAPLVDDEKRREWERITQACREAGLTSPASVSGSASVSPERRKELLHLANGEPLSEIIIKDREDRV